MDLEPVRAAYAAVVDEYVSLADDAAYAGDVDWDFVRRHLAGLPGRVLDLGCGPGRWTADLHALGVDVLGVDLVPGFVEHARATYPGVDVRLGSMTDLDVPDGSVAGIVAWYSTIHLPPDELGGVLAGWRRLLVDGGTLVVGFFDGDDDVEPFEHAVVTAYRWPADVFADRLLSAGFAEVERIEPYAPRPGRRYAGIAVRAV